MDAVAFLLVLIAIYFAPSIIGKGHKNFASILVVNLFLGWTLVGWVVALAWALKKE